MFFDTCIIMLFMMLKSIGFWTGFILSMVLFVITGVPLILALIVSVIVGGVGWVIEDVIKNEK
jgi:predicted membrane chloride channel (bestrophin family)